LPKNRIRGSRVNFTTRTGPSSDLSPIAQPACGHIYDKTASARLVYPNGLQSSFTYDTQNRVTALSNAAASYTYTLDGTVGNRKGVTERLATQTHPRIVGWGYDNIYRLTNENISADPNSKTGSVTYGLDPVGNRLSLGLSQGSNLPVISPIQPNSISYDHDDRLSTENYDPNGNTLTTAGKTFAYDFENRLKSLNNGAVTIQYDADGNRVAKTVAGVTTRYLVDDLNPTGYAQVVEEVTGTTASRTYTYGLQRISQNQQIANAWTPSFYGYDGGGTVRLLTDSTGTVTDTYDYDAWGNTVNTTGSTPNVYLYRGEHYDADLDLYYLRARYFNPLSGRFLTRDPEAGRIKVPASLHKYLYSVGDPINVSDPTGRAPLSEQGLLMQIVKPVAYAGVVICFTITAIDFVGGIYNHFNSVFPPVLGWSCKAVTLVAAGLALGLRTPPQ
jgi:RHS repeat-associated protein